MHIFWFAIVLFIVFILPMLAPLILAKVFQKDGTYKFIPSIIFLIILFYCILVLFFGDEYEYILIPPSLFLAGVDLIALVISLLLQLLYKFKI